MLRQNKLNVLHFTHRKSTNGMNCSAVSISIAVVFASFFILHSSKGQSVENTISLGYGVISGTITDCSTNLPLVGVDVFIESIRLGSVTDLNGNYKVSQVPLGIYTLVVSQIGYHRITVDSVSVKESQEIVHNFKSRLWGETCHYDQEHELLQLLESLTDSDKKEIIRESLNIAIGMKEIPSYELFRRSRTVIVSNDNIQRHWVTRTRGKRLEVQSVESIKSLANQKGDFTYISFSPFAITENGDIEVIVHHVWALSEKSKGQYIILSGGGLLLTFSKRDSGWMEIGSRVKWEH